MELTFNNLIYAINKLEIKKEKTKKESKLKKYLAQIEEKTNEKNILGIKLDKKMKKIKDKIIKDAKDKNKRDQELLQKEENEMKKKEKLNSNLYMYDSEEIKKALENIPTNINYNLIKYFSMFTYDCVTYEKFTKKINFLTDSHFTCYEHKPIIKLYQIVNSTYYYKLGITLSLIKLNMFFAHKGYPVTYKNWDNPNSMLMMIPIDIIENINTLSNFDRKNLDNKSKKIKAHRFNINKSGSITQRSPSTIKDASYVKNLVLKEIIDYHENFSMLSTNEINEYFNK